MRRPRFVKRVGLRQFAVTAFGVLVLPDCPLQVQNFRLCLAFRGWNLKYCLFLSGQNGQETQVGIFQRPFRVLEWNQNYDNNTVIQRFHEIFLTLHGVFRFVIINDHCTQIGFNFNHTATVLIVIG